MSSLIHQAQPEKQRAWKISQEKPQSLKCHEMEVMTNQKRISKNAGTILKSVTEVNWKQKEKACKTEEILD